MKILRADREMFFMKTPLGTTMMICLFLVLCLVWPAAGYASLPANTINVTFVNPDKPGNPFWDLVTEFMKASADSLDIELQVIYGDADRYVTTSKAIAAIQASPRPDYLVFMYQKGQGYQILDAAERHQVHTFIINTDIPEAERARVGHPRERYRFWLGHMFPDDVTAGQLLTQQLVEAARKARPSSSPVSRDLIALSGSRDSSAALDRNRGLENALAADPDVRLRQLIFTGWSAEQTLDQTLALLKRYPDVTLIWGASDGIALGAIDGSRQSGRVPGKDIFIGGMDWSAAGIQAVRDGTLVVTLGGHFMEGGWALVLLHDYHYGRDFSDIGLTLKSPMQAVTAANVVRFQYKMDASRWKSIPFHAFSRARHPALTTYDFRLERLLDSP